MSRPSFGEVRSLLTQTWTEWNKDQVPRLGAALSYYTALSLAPLLILLLAIAGVVFGAEAARGQLFAQIQDMVGTEGAKAIEQMVQSASKLGSGIVATLIGVGTLVFGASTVAQELQSSLNVIWNRPDDTGGITDIVKTRGKTLGIVLGAGFLLLTSLAISSMIAAAGKWFANLIPLPEMVLTAINLAVGVLVIAGVFAVLFRFLPNVRPAWSDVILGAIFTSVLFSIGRWAIGLYLGKASFGSTYGAAGSLIIVLVWVYYSAQIFFFGAEFTKVYARERGTDPLQIRARRHAPRQEAAQPPTHEPAPPVSPPEPASGLAGTLIGSALAFTRMFRALRK